MIRNNFQIIEITLNFLPAFKASTMADGWTQILLELGLSAIKAVVGIYKLKTDTSVEIAKIHQQKIIYIVCAAVAVLTLVIESRRRRN